MPVHGLDQFKSDLRATSDAIPNAVRDGMARAIAEGLDDLILLSPVKSGAFRASHTVMEGDGGPEAYLWEGPNRQPDDLKIDAGFGSALPAPSAGEALAAMLGAGPFERWWLRNGRFYASWLEDGTSSMAPRHYYALTAGRIERAVSKMELRLPGAK